ncbi:MAG: AmmeMemoRadiSam system protein B [Candidatus Hydrogenedentota bacterium]
MSDALPAMRYVETFVVEHEGQPHVCLADPTGLVNEQVLLSPHAYLVAASLDGERGLAQVQEEFARHCNGVQLETEHIMRLVDSLDESGFLLSPRYFALAEAAARAYREAPHRALHHAGQSYPEEPENLRIFLERCFTGNGGPGPLPDQPGNGPPPRALIVPHIDFHRGAFAYAHGYKRLYEAGKPDTVIIFGVAHMSGATPFILTRKDFETPFGVLPVAGELVDELAAACTWDPFEDELVHRTEHSIEFQAVMLAYLFGPSVRIVPVLCGPMADEDDPGVRRVSPAVEPFLAACRAITGRADERTMVLAGADLAHVGQRFGDEFDIDDTILAATAARDEEDLAEAAAGSAPAWYASVMKDDNQRRVCGLGCIYAMLKSVEGRHDGGQMLHYGYAPDPMGGIVSFATMAFP